MKHVFLPLVGATMLGAAGLRQSEPAARVLRAIPLNLKVEFGDLAGARELPNGQILVSDAAAPAIVVIDPATGTQVRKIGREGQGPNEYKRPGGIYYSLDGTTSLVVDRAQARVFVIDKSGALTAMQSIEQRGVSFSADHVDPRRVDAAFHAYFVDQGAVFRAAAGRGSDSMAVLRFDASRQAADTVAKLFHTKPTIISSNNGMTRSRTPIFSPADGWAVASDGSVAIVRATPYRIDWIAPNGQVTPGPTVAYTAVAVTEGDRKAFESSGTASISGGRRSSDGRTTMLSGGNSKPEFASVKPAFDPNEIVVSLDGRLWVGRHVGANSKQVVYDVFDRRGARVDRVALPARSRVIGFGPNAVFVSRLTDDDVPTLEKYPLSS